MKKYNKKEEEEPSNLKDKSLNLQDTHSDIVNIYYKINLALLNTFGKIVML